MSDVVNKQKLISINDEVANRLRRCKLYEPGDSYRVVIVKLLDRLDKK
jgi:predicted CopG family antitoxin